MKVIFLSLFRSKRLRSIGPKQKFSVPVLSSQEIGWREPIELFGVCQFAKKTKQIS